jgi:CBS domain-containing protein
MTIDSHASDDMRGKAMKISDLKLEPLQATHPDESIADVAERMHFYEVGSLAVLDEGSLVGIVTERDVLSSVADRSDPNRFTVRFYMTSGPTTISSDTDLGDAAELMLGLGVRHLPVVEGGRPVGMVSIRDVLVAELETERDLAVYG